MQNMALVVGQASPIPLAAGSGCRNPVDGTPVRLGCGAPLPPEADIFEGFVTAFKGLSF